MKMRALFLLAVLIVILCNTLASAQAPVSTPRADALSQQDEYVVKSGDSMAAIAKRYGVTLGDLTATNNLSSSTLRVGQRLIVPKAANPEAIELQTPRPSAGSEPQQDEYVVKSGDSMSAIAKRYGITPRTLRAANNMASDRLRVGQRLIVPGATNKDVQSKPPSPIQQDCPSVSSQSSNTNMTPVALVDRVQSLHQELVVAIKAQLTLALDSAEPEVALSTSETFITKCINTHAYFGLEAAIVAATNNLANSRIGIESQQNSTTPELREQYEALGKAISVLHQRLDTEQSRMKILREQLGGLSKNIASWQGLYQDSAKVLGVGPAREQLKKAVVSGAKEWLSITQSR